VAGERDLDGPDEDFGPWDAAPHTARGLFKCGTSHTSMNLTTLELNNTH
jgi:hypothetical protein